MQVIGKMACRGSAAAIADKKYRGPAAARISKVSMKAPISAGSTRCMTDLQVLDVGFGKSGRVRCEKAVDIIHGCPGLGCYRFRAKRYLRGKS